MSNTYCIYSEKSPRVQLRLISNIMFSCATISQTSRYDTFGDEIAVAMLGKEKVFEEDLSHYV